MNPSSLSISDVGKSNTLLQSGVGDSKMTPDSDDSGRFLSTLGAIFQSDNGTVESTEKTKVNEVQSDVDGNSVDELIESSEEVSESIGSDNNDESLLTKEASNLSEDDTASTSDKNSQGEPEKAAKAMSEGNQLLGRLDESKQVLTSNSGKPLPQSQQTLDQNQLDVVSDSANNGMASMTHDSKGAQVELRDGEPVSTTEQEALDLAHNEFVSDVNGVMQSSSYQDKALDNNELAQVSTAGGLLVEQSVDGKGSNTTNGTQGPEWGSANATAGGSVLSAYVEPSAISQSANTDSTLSVSATGEIVEEGVVQSDTMLASSQASVLEGSDNQPQVNWSNSSAEQNKASIDTAKMAVGSTAAIALNHQQTQGVQPTQPHHFAQAQSMPSDNATAAIQIPLSTPDKSELALQAGSLNPVPVSSANSAQNQTLQAALATGGLLAGVKSQGHTKDNAKDSGLSQQISGLAAQQGVQQTQVKADMQQAIAQSPLQLSREAAGEKVSEQVQMMMSKNLKNVDIRLDPPELGRMQIRMSMNSDIASIQFTVSNPQAKDMVEQAMPRLREMLAQQGVQLADSSVQQQSSGQQQQYSAENDNGRSAGTTRSSGEEEGNLDESINLDVNISTKDDGISYYA